MKHKIDINYRMKNAMGKDMFQQIGDGPEQEPMYLGSIVSQALSANLEDDKRTAVQRVESWKISQQILNKDEYDPESEEERLPFVVTSLSPSDITMIQETVAKAFPQPYICGQVHCVLEGDDEE